MREVRVKLNGLIGFLLTLSLFSPSILFADEDKQTSWRTRVWQAGSKVKETAKSWFGKEDKKEDDDLMSLFCSEDEEELLRQLSGNPTIGKRTTLRLSYEEIKSDDPREWLLVYLKYRQLLGAALYRYMPCMCPQAEKGFRQDITRFWSKVSADPKVLIDGDTYAVITEVSSLHLAALFNHEKLMKALLKAGANPDALDGLGFTPLHYASGVQVARLLLEEGAHVNAPSNTGLTPLHLAFTGNIARLLLARGAKMTEKDKWGNTPLHIAKFLGMNSSRISVRRSDGKRARYTSAGKSEQTTSVTSKIAHWLISMGVKLDKTICHILDTLDVAKVLLKYGAQGLPNSAGNTPDDVEKIRLSRSDWDD